MNDVVLVPRTGWRPELVIKALLCGLLAAAWMCGGIQAADFTRIYQPADGEAAARAGSAAAWVNPPVARHYRIDGSLGSVLAAAPREAARGPNPLRIMIPRPDGTLEEFDVAEAPVMAPELMADFPEIRTYVGQGVNDPQATARLGWSPVGFYAQVLSPRGAYYIEPRFRGDNVIHACFFRRDYRRPVDGFSCLTTSPTAVPRTPEPAGLLRSGPTLHTYRLAVACTGEYAAFFGGTVSGVMNAIVQAVNRVTGIYEVEVGVRLSLVANNQSLIFTNAATDPYNNVNGNAMLVQNQTTVDAIIGSANYDIGHVFSTGGGGVALLGCVCLNGIKAQGVTGLPAPVGDAFYVDFVAHEMGHQFGGNHPFNGINGNCGGGNRNGPTAYEPGSGSTIMAYAGICGADDLQLNSDPYFHSISFDEIITFISGIGGSCASNSITGNAAPTVSAGLPHTIPIGTPFVLTASGSDPDGDPLTYCWEQRDLGPAQAVSAADNGSSPLFRSFNPTNSPSRTFPKLSSILSGTNVIGERLPALGRTMRFRVTARDNRGGGGGVNTADVALTVDATAGPFIVTSPNGGTNPTGPLNVTWNVANTTNAAVNATTVNIRLSVDGGQTFPVLLATNIPNTGNQLVIVPPVSTTQGRIKVEAASNVFFDISNSNLTFQAIGGADIALSGSAPSNALEGTPVTATYTVVNNGPGLGAGITVAGSVPVSAILLGTTTSQGTVTTNGGQLVFDIGTLNSGSSATLTISLLPIVAGTLTNSMVAQAATLDPVPGNTLVSLFTTITPALPTLAGGPARLVAESIQPFNGAIEPGESVKVEFGLSVVSGVANSLVGVLLFEGGVVSPGTAQNYGRVTPSDGVVSRPYTFTAAAGASNIVARVRFFDRGIDVGTLTYVLPVGGVVVGTASNSIAIPDSGPASPYPSTIQIDGLSGVVASVSVNLVKFNHTFPADVDILLVSPSGERVMLMSDAGGGVGATNLFLTFDDAATASLPGAGPLVSGTFKPTDFEPGDSLPAPAPGGAYAASLTAFAGSNPNGTWSLYVADDMDGDSGNIAGGWSLSVATQVKLNQPGDTAATLAVGGPAVAGFPLTYTVVVSNRGPTTAYGVTVSDTLPAGVAFNSVTASQGFGVNLNGTVTATLGSLPPGGTARVTISGTPSAAGLITNSAAVFASQTDTNLLNNTATLVTVVSNPAPLLVPGNVVVTSESLVTNAAVDAGEVVTLELGLRNIGTAATTNLTATLLSVGGVTSLSDPQNFGALQPNGPEIARPFMFSAGAGSNGIITVNLQLTDGSIDLGVAVFTFNVSTTTSGGNSTPIVIPLAGAASPYPSVIQLAGVTGIVSKISVTLSNLSHTFPDDVDVLLVSPGGQRVLLMSDAGGGTPADAVTLTFEDTAASSLPDGAALASGTYRPTDYLGTAGDDDNFPVPAPAGPYAGQLSVFNGSNPNGAWSLYVTDDTGGDQGVIAGGWRIDVTTVQPINPVADLDLSVTASASTVVVGSNVTFLVTVTNRGPTTANGVVVTNAIPAFTQLLDASAFQGSVLTAGGQLYASLGTLSNGASASFTFVVGTLAGGTLSNLAGVFSGTPDLLGANNTRLTLVHVLASSPATLGGVTPKTDGTFLFVLNGQDNAQYVIEASTDLVNWTPIATNTPSNGKIIFTDTNAIVEPYRFYRAFQLP